MGHNRLTLLLISGVSLAACNGGQWQSATPAGGAYLPQGQSVPIYQVSAPVAPVSVLESAPDYMHSVPSMYNQQLGDNSNSITILQQRLERLERAMIRLDRRMQLVESNELGRMSSREIGSSHGKIASAAQINVGVGSALDQNIIPPKAAPYPAGMLPVNAIISNGLQAAPVKGYNNTAKNNYVKATSSRLPSLADKDDNSNIANASMTVWTIRYAAGKIWPDKSQLPSSRNVVSALRQGKPIALFARGSNPNSREFRERVRALGKYLSKVSDLENVAISTMVAQQLDSNTVEIFATE